MIIYSDLISLILVFYVWIRVHQSIHMDRNSKIAFYFSGLGLALILSLDFLWECLFNTMEKGESRQFLMNLVVCIMYMLLPLTVSTPMICKRKDEKGRHYRVVGILICIYLLSAIANVFHPIFFWHDDTGMRYTELSPFMYTACLALFIYVTLEVYARKFSFDREDDFMIAISAFINVIGITAAQLAYDVVTLWMTMSISYLFLYLAIEEMYSKTDPITGLKNRSSFTKQMKRTRAREGFTLAVFDANNLKKYNDTMGHLKGDAYLRFTALTLSRYLESLGTVYRIGGDEFCLFSNAPEEEVRKSLHDLVKTESGDTEEAEAGVDTDAEFKLDIAFGVASRTDQEEPVSVLNRADKEMYKNKTLMKKNRTEE